MANAELQLNESEQGYFRIPYTAFKTPLYGNGSRPMRGKGLALYGFISSISQGEKACNMSYNRFEEKFCISHGTVARGIKTLKKANAVVQDKSRRSCASYTSPKPNKSGIKVEIYLYHVKFKFRGKIKPRKLTDSQCYILSLMKTHCENPKGEDFFIGSVRSIAKTLNLSEKTVRDSLNGLFRADLIFRPKEWKGVNAKQRSKFTVNFKLLREAKKQYKKETSPQAKMNKLAEGVCHKVGDADARDPRKQSSDKPTSEYQKKVEDANARAEFDRYYANLRNLAESRADAFNRRAEADNTYNVVNTALNSLEMKLGQAEVYYPERLEALLQDKKELEAKRAKRLAELGITEADLIPKYRCQKCSDKGYLPSGKMCDCYPRRGRT